MTYFCAFSSFNNVNISSTVKICIPLNVPRESRWLSPDTMQSALPSKAVLRMVSSAGSAFITLNLDFIRVNFAV